jgi:diaminohydroxyphosphoribosylaminopyrimidine deaminase / 5-amino-6-(5-phosphoribosylamino)uracil reductase
MSATTFQPPAGAGFTAAEEAAMRTALAAAAEGVRGANPLVGAVLLSADGTVLAVGKHSGAGTAHAEVDALAAVPAGRRNELPGATMVVTLEPCNHTGRTGACSRAILDAGIRHVVFAVRDPHDVASGGAETLSAAGVEVRAGLLERDAVELNRRWFAAVRAGRPFTTLHLAQSLDGRIAAADGTSQWITSDQARADSHRIRARADALLAGTGTIRIDNPRLTARRPDGTPADKQPLRVAMGLTPVPETAEVRKDDWFLQLHTRDAGLAVRELHDRGVRHLMVEGGATVSAAFLAADLVDELVVYQAPTLLGAGTPAVAGLGIDTISAAQHWRWDDTGGGAVVRLGPDLRLSLYRGNGPTAAPTEGH